MPLATRDEGSTPDIDEPADLESGPLDLVAPDVGEDLRPVLPSGDTEVTFGVVSGPCAILADDVLDPSPSFHVQTYTFDAAFDPAALVPLAQKRLSSQGAGGSSKCSEAMSMQTLADCAGFVPLKAELDILFDVEGQTTDWLAQAGEVRVGVSVSRAYQGPTDDEYTVEDATTLLKKKLGGIAESTANVSDEDAWAKQYLHIWTLQPTWVPTLKEAWDALDPALRGDTVVVVTVEVGSGLITPDDCQ